MGVRKAHDAPTATAIKKGSDEAPNEVAMLIAMGAIKIAAAALEIPQEAVDHVIKHGTSRHRSKACTVLCEFALKYAD